MGFRSTSLIRLAALGALVPACGIGVGFFAADLERLQLSSKLHFTTEAEAHTQDLASSSHIRDSQRDGDVRPLSADARHLFSRASKGPRADRYGETAQTMTIQKRPVHMASLTGGAGDITGSIPPAAVHRVAVHRSTKADPIKPPIDKSAGMLPEPLDTRPSATLFLASLLSPQAYRFPGSEESKPEGPSKLPRGLAFQGETEDEYQARQRRCLATAIYFEARGESERGQLAVAQVVMNRVRSSLYPDTICGVVFQGQLRRSGCQFSFTCDGHADVPKDKERWLLANRLAKKVTDGKVWLPEIGHATHYHATYVKPAWRRELDHVKRVGRHIFYRVRTEQIEDVLSGSGNQETGLALAKSE